MLLYRKEFARDLIFPNNKKTVTDLYKAALTDIAKEQYIFHPFKLYMPIPMRREYWNYHTYGNIAGLHMVTNSNILELRISTVVTPHMGYMGPSPDPNRIFRASIDSLHHKIRRFKAPSLVKKLQYPMSGFNNPVADYIVIGRMVVKLGSMKKPLPSFMDPFSIIPPLPPFLR